MVQFKIENDNLVFSFPERLDTIKCQEIEKEVMQKIDEESKLKVVFDLKDVKYIASSFLRIIVQVVKKVTSPNFNIANVPPEIKKVLKMAGFDKSITIE
jgi:anti-anti-sigma factor